MKRLLRINMMQILLLIAIGSWGCSSYEELNVPTKPMAQEAKSIVDDSAYNDSLGRINAVKKAYQMTDIQFVPKNNIRANGSLVYKAGQNYQGLIYSSVKELAQFVGEEVSFHTFMTAVNNPRSKIYTEDVSKAPYHGLTCRAYYGTVCSGLVSYALGFYPKYFANDFPLMDSVKEVDSTMPDSLQIADVLWRNGHVALITNIVKDNNGNFMNVEICESIGSGARKYRINADEYQELMRSSFKKIYRYKDIYKNIDYTPIPEFVAVLDENPIHFQYNDDLCVDKGDKSCYLENEMVVVNVMRPYDYMEIYKDSNIYRITETNSEDINLTDLSYGDYKARICYDGHYSDFTYWKVVNVNVILERKSNKIYFTSTNATPLSVRYCDIQGNGGGLYSSKRRILTEEEKRQGFINVFPDEVPQNFPYIRVYFQTDYGRIINTPLNWFE